MEEHGVVLQPHQRRAIQALETAYNRSYPIVVLPCRSKIVPDEQILVICAVLPDVVRDRAEVVPIACLGPEPLETLCEAPATFGTKLTVTIVDHIWILNGK